MITNQNNHSTNLPNSVKLNSKKSVGVVLTNVTRIMLSGYAHLSSVEFAGFIIALFYLLFEKVKEAQIYDPLPASDKELSDRLTLDIRQVKKYLRIAKYMGVIVVKERGVGLKVSKYYLKIPTSKPDPKVKQYLIRLFRKGKWLKYSRFREREKRALESYLIAKRKENLDYSSIAFQFRAIPSYRNRPEKRTKRAKPIIDSSVENIIDNTVDTYPLRAFTKGNVVSAVASKGFVSKGSHSLEGLKSVIEGKTKPIQEKPVFISRDFEKTQNIDRKLWQIEWDKTATDFEEIRHKLERREIDGPEYDRQLEIIKAKRAELEEAIREPEPELQEAIPF